MPVDDDVDVIVDVIVDDDEGTVVDDDCGVEGVDGDAAPPITHTDSVTPEAHPRGTEE